MAAGRQLRAHMYKFVEAVSYDLVAALESQVPDLEGVRLRFIDAVLSEWGRITADDLVSRRYTHQNKLVKAVLIETWWIITRESHEHIYYPSPKTLAAEFNSKFPMYVTKCTPARRHVLTRVIVWGNFIKHREHALEIVVKNSYSSYGLEMREIKPWK